MKAPRSRERHVTGLLKSGNSVSVFYYMVTPDMYFDFKTYSVTGTILEDNKVMVALKARENSPLKREPDNLTGGRSLTRTVAQSGPPEKT